MFIPHGEINSNLTTLTRFNLRNFNSTYISLVDSKAYKTATGLQIIQSVVNIKARIPSDTTNLFTTDDNKSGFLLVIQPGTGKTFIIRVSGGTAYAVGAIEPCDTCTLFGILL